MWTDAVGNYCRVAKQWTNKAEIAGQDTAIYPYFLNLTSSIRCDDAFSWHDISSPAFILSVTWSNKHVDIVIVAQNFLIQGVLQRNSTTSAEWFIVIISVPATNIHQWKFRQMLLWSVNSVAYTVHVLLLEFSEFTIVRTYCCGNTWNAWSADRDRFWRKVLKWTLWVQNLIFKCVKSDSQSAVLLRCNIFFLFYFTSTCRCYFHCLAWIDDEMWEIWRNLLYPLL